MKTSLQNNIRLTWQMAYVALIKNFLSAEDVLNYIEPSELSGLDADTISSLYSTAEESKEAFLKTVKKIIGDISEEDMRKCIEKWSLAYLKDIYLSDQSIREKLHQIANVWAMFDYPEDLKNIIYYMPVTGNEMTSELTLYRDFEEFVNRQDEIMTRE